MDPCAAEALQLCPAPWSRLAAHLLAAASPAKPAAREGWAWFMEHRGIQQGLGGLSRSLLSGT